MFLVDKMSEAYALNEDFRTFLVEDSRMFLVDKISEACALNEDSRTLSGL